MTLFSAVALWAAAAEGLFAVSGSKAVVFAPGNLQYQASTGAWRFAEHQWDIIGEAAGNNVYGTARESQEAWIDLFAWATSGLGTAAAHYQPWDLTKSIEYGPAKDGTTWPSINETEYDWGYAKGVPWRTLTEQEWYYVLNHHAKAFITTPYQGLLVLPITYPSSTIIDGAQFDTYIANGALFLPAAGWQDGTGSNYEIKEVGTQCNYWSSTSPNSEGGMAYALEFEQGGVPGLKPFERYNGFSVRLAKDAGAAVVTISDRPADVAAQKSLLEDYKESEEEINVRLERTLYDDGWNTLCLPFTLEKAAWQAAFGATAKVYNCGTGTHIEEDGDKKTLEIDMVALDGPMDAGVPYIIIPEHTGSSYYFEGVTITESEGEGESLPESGDDIQFLGIINRTQLTPGAKHYLFVTATNVLMWPDASDTGTMFGTRAYFYVPDLKNITPGMPARMRILEAANTTTAVEQTAVQTGVSKRLVDGQMVIVRGGETFTIMGQSVK